VMMMGIFNACKDCLTKESVNGAEGQETTQVGSDSE